MTKARSMTGFGRATTQVGHVNLVIEVSTVNQRGLAILVHLPSEWTELELRISGLARDFFQRGKVTVRVAATRSHTEGLDLTESLRKLRELAAKHGISGQPDWHVLQRLVEKQEGEAGSIPVDDALIEAIEQCARNAFKACDTMRASEGIALVRDLSARVDAIESLVDRIAKIEQAAPLRHRDRLFKRLEELGVGVNLNDERVLKELALHADRCDVSEELTRLHSHLAQARTLLKSSAAGRALDFLTQEFLREINTIGSKGAEVETTQAVVASKTEIERFREQVQNLE